MSDAPAYQVLARKYRPQTFADLIGQEAMVRTLKNAFAADRIAHAFVMTGVRGVGKTTTARIVAKGLNCIGADGAGGPTTEPCGLCEPCIAIAEGRHVDVMEMDAASRTGVGDIREIIESVQYRAASARYKIYIIDEVHMLSTNAFNALLKTLEEPPPHVKFIFATTEIRKVPVTILSRCQRYDLRRIEPEVMLTHLRGILAAEGAAVADDALALITRAAEGSVRDALSLLDQAISHGAGETSAIQVRAMLGLADRGRVLDLLDLVMSGNAAGALGELAAQYADGADPIAVLRDLAEVTHWISVVQITPDAALDPTIPPDERTRGQDMASRLPMRVLSRMWQMLLKALEEVALAPNTMMAAEMVLIRLTHAADLPDPASLIRRIQEAGPAQSAGRAVSGLTGSGGGASKGVSGGAVSSGPVSGGAISSGAVSGGAGSSGAASYGAVSSGAVSYGAVSSGPVSSGPASYGAVSGATGSGRSVSAGSAPGGQDDGASAAGASGANAPGEDLARGFPSGSPASGASASAGPPSARPAAAGPATSGPRVSAAIGGAHALASAEMAPDTAALAMLCPDFEAVTALIRDRRDIRLLVEVEEYLHLARYSPGRIEFAPAAGAPSDLAARLAGQLQVWTGARWGVSVVGSGGAPTIAQTRAVRDTAVRDDAARHPVVRAVLDAFAGSRIVDIRPLTTPDPVEPVAGGTDDPARPFQGSASGLDDGYAGGTDGGPADTPDDEPDDGSYDSADWNPFEED